jgi:hypothetical protein
VFRHKSLNGSWEGERTREPIVRGTGFGLPPSRACKRKLELQTNVRVHVTVLAGLVLILLTGGCGRPRKTQPPVDPATLDDAAFQAYLADVPVVTVDEACRAMLVLADGHDATKDWSQRSQELLRRGWIRSAWGLRPDYMVDRGTVAYMICKICKIHGGVDRLILGSWGLGDRRYAYRELVYRDLMPPGTEYEVVTGGQMVGLMGKADSLMEKKHLYQTEKFDLGEKPASRAE